MTADEIQDLIDAALGPDGSGIATVPAGQHVLNKALRLRPGLRLRGLAGQTVLRTQNPEVNHLELIRGDDPAPHNVKISGLHLLGPRTSDDITDQVSSNADKGCGIRVFVKQQPQPDGVEQVVKNITIEKCRIENVSGCGIRFDTREDVLMKDIRILNCELVQNGRPAEQPKPPERSGPANYKDILFYGTRFEDIVIQGNTCVFTPTDESAYGNDSGIAFVANFDNRGEPDPAKWRLGYVKNTQILDNTCSGHRRHGIITNYGYLVADGVTARGNTCHDNRWVGLYVNTARKVEKGNLAIEENVCHNNGYGGLARPGVSTDPAQDSDASIRGGIVLNGCFNSQIARNQCNNNGVPSAGFTGEDTTKDFAAGIRVRGLDLVLDANVAQNNLAKGIQPWPGPYDEARIQIIEPASTTPTPEPVTPTPEPVTPTPEPEPEPEPVTPTPEPISMATTTGTTSTTPTMTETTSPAKEEPGRESWFKRLLRKIFG